MMMFAEKSLKEYAECHPEAKSAIQDCIKR